VAHGIEMPARRAAVGKRVPDESRFGKFAMQPNQSSPSSFRETGAGLDIGRLRARAVGKRLLDSQAATELDAAGGGGLRVLAGNCLGDGRG